MGVLRYTFGATSYDERRVLILILVFIHSSLRLTDKVSSIVYNEDTIKWSTDTAIEKTDSESDSEDDIERG